VPRKPRKGLSRSRGDFEARCTITKVTGVDHQGRPALGEKSEELCSILKLPGDNADVSAKIGSSPEHSTVPPRLEDAVLLLRISTKGGINDIIEVAGLRLKAIAISPSYDSVGKIAYLVVQAVICD